MGLGVLTAELALGAHAVQVGRDRVVIAATVMVSRVTFSEASGVVVR